MLGFASALALSGCSYFDRREQVAFQTLAEGEGFSKPAYSAALAARFPRGSSIDGLRTYVIASGGTCHTRASDQLWCEIPYRIGLCAAAMIGLDVAVSDNSVSSIRVEFGGLSC
jgi:hypothetical protein